MKTIATWIVERDEGLFARMFAPYPGLRLANARRDPVSLDEASALLLTGGSDIGEPFLRQPIDNAAWIQDPDLERDAWEFDAVARALARRLPILGICRGHQVLNVALGGTLHLHVPNHAHLKFCNVQPVRYAPGMLMRFPCVNSSHHQALDRLGAGLVAEGWSVEDGVIERVRLEDYPFALSVQFHPERDELYRPLFDAFVDRLELGAR